jgi:toxin-antitoxin system PIN domain toxin
VIAIDTNILVHAHRFDSKFNEIAYERVTALANGMQPWGIPVACLSEFLCIVTNPKIYKPCSTFEEALNQVDIWLSSPSAHILHSGSQHWRILSELTRTAKLQGGQFHDARVAAICIESGVSTLWSADRDFTKFKSLKTFNPLT